MLSQWVISGIGSCGSYVEKRSAKVPVGSQEDMANETHYTLCFLNATSSTLERLVFLGEGNVELHTWRHKL